MGVWKKKNSGKIKEFKILEKISISWNKFTSTRDVNNLIKKDPKYMNRSLWSLVKGVSI